MSTKELKESLKPLIKQCIREVVFEEGFLSGLISEVVKGTGAPVIRETQQPETKVKKPSPPRRSSNNEFAKNIMKETFGGEFYGQVFEGLEPISSKGVPGEVVQPKGALSGFSPDDEGVDVGRLFGSMQDTWKKLI